MVHKSKERPSRLEELRNAALQMQDHEFQEPYPNTTSERCEVDDYTDMFEEYRIVDGKILYLVTSTYKDSSEFPLTAAKADFRFDQCRKRLLAYLCGTHKYNRPDFHAIEPIMYGCLDTSGSKIKHKKQSKASKHPSRFHHHYIIAVDKSHSAKIDALMDSELNAQFLEKKCKNTQLRTLHIQRISPSRADTYRVINYCSGSNRMSADGKFEPKIFPISAGEFQKAA